jgi:hypothetical protein
MTMFTRPRLTRRDYATELVGVVRLRQFAGRANSCSAALLLSALGVALMLYRGAMTTVERLAAAHASPSRVAPLPPWLRFNPTIGGTTCT